MEVECLALKDLTSPRKSFTVETEEDGGQSEQKENICTERRRSTPLKSPDPAALLLCRKGSFSPELVHMTPVKHTALAEPWTPTANLKMLISAASPDIRDREMRKVLFRPIENEKDAPLSPGTGAEDTEVEDSCQFEAAEEEDDTEKRPPSRKQKSLGLLCQKFLALYPDYPPPHSPIWISLDEVATSLGVERRRIYDIVNVLESLMIVGRMAKNSYTWYGRQRLEPTLEELQRRGRQQGYHLQMELAAEAREAGAGREEDGADGDSPNAGGNRKDKSLRIMSQKFVMLFLVSKTQTVTLDAAAKILIEESQDSSSHSKYKTKVRRLYDIANVLTSLGLIKKVHVRDERGRKPAFKWLGQVEFNNAASSGNTAVAVPEATQPMSSQDLRKSKMTRHASFNIAPNPVSVQRQVNSAPSSPGGEHTRLTNQQPVDYSKRTTGNNAVCRLQFGNSTDMHPSATQLQTPTPPPPPSVQPEHLFTAPPSPRCMAYLPSLSQPSVVMLYRAPDRPDQGQSSPRMMEGGAGRKRRREGDQGADEETRKKGTAGSEESDMMRAEAVEFSQTGNARTSAGLSFDGGNSSTEPTQPSHYLYVPNNAGLNSLNFLLSAGQSHQAGLALPPSSLALPYVLVPSSALSHYNLVGPGLQHFMVGSSPYALATTAASEVNRSPVPSPSTPEQSRLYWSSASMPHSPSGPSHTVSINTPEAMTPKETTPSASKAFFQTPGTLGNVVSAVPVARKRGSAQRRLDVGHPPTS